MLLWQYIVNAFWFITLHSFPTPPNPTVTTDTSLLSDRLTVGLLGHNGRAGSAVLNALAPLNDKNYTVVILHRPGSNLSNVPSGIETREIDLTKKDGEEYDQAVKNLNVLISTVSGSGISAQSALFPALSRSKGFISFFPSDLAAPWTKEDFEGANLSFLKGKEDVLHAAKKAGVAVTIMKTGVFAELDFRNPSTAVDAKQNIVNVYKESLTSPKYIASLPYIGQAYVDLLSRPSELTNQYFYINEYNTTHQKIADILTTIHGKPPTFKYWTEEQMHNALNSEPWPALLAALLRKSGEHRWDFPGKEAKVHGWKSKPLEERLREVVDEQR